MMQRVVLDTNVFLVCISERSRLHWIFSKLQAGEYMLCVTTEILAEYAEIIGRHMGEEASESALGTLENLPNVEFVTTYFRFQLMKDEDDNKFVDCAVAGNASFIVSHDRDFKVLENIEFPKVKVIDTEAFRKTFEEQT